MTTKAELDALNAAADRAWNALLSEQESCEPGCVPAFTIIECDLANAAFRSVLADMWNDGSLVHMDEMKEFVEEVLEYCDGREDVNWEGDGPNAEMTLGNSARALLAKLESKP